MALRNRLLLFILSSAVGIAQQVSYNDLKDKPAFIQPTDKAYGCSTTKVDNSTCLSAALAYSNNTGGPFRCYGQGTYKVTGQVTVTLTKPPDIDWGQCTVEWDGAATTATSFIQYKTTSASVAHLVEGGGIHGGHFVATHQVKSFIEMRELVNVHLGNFTLGLSGDYSDPIPPSCVLGLHWEVAGAGIQDAYVPNICNIGLRMERLTDITQNVYTGMTLTSAITGTAGGTFTVSSCAFLTAGGFDVIHFATGESIRLSDCDAGTLVATIAEVCVITTLTGLDPCRGDEATTPTTHTNGTAFTTGFPFVSDQTISGVHLYGVGAGVLTCPGCTIKMEDNTYLAGSGIGMFNNGGTYFSNLVHNEGPTYDLKQMADGSTVALGTVFNNVDVTSGSFKGVAIAITGTTANFQAVNPNYAGGGRVQLSLLDVQIDPSVTLTKDVNARICNAIDSSGIVSVYNQCTLTGGVTVKQEVGSTVSGVVSETTTAGGGGFSVSNTGGIANYYPLIGTGGGPWLCGDGNVPTRLTLFPSRACSGTPTWILDGTYGIRHAPVTVANLPGCSNNTEGIIIEVTDALTPAWGANVANGGVVHATVVCNQLVGWTVIGK